MSSRDYPVEMSYVLRMQMIASRQLTRGIRKPYNGTVIALPQCLDDALRDRCFSCLIFYGCFCLITLRYHFYLEKLKIEHEDLSNGIYTCKISRYDPLDRELLIVDASYFNPLEWGNGITPSGNGIAYVVQMLTNQMGINDASRLKDMLHAGTD